ncbi:ATP-binding protein [Pseudomonas sp. KNUC1026]|uniref:ATP-binding protein n=1 Tax=Pseudomonas sp. KNUC1026 TaxID=2893890 RepID=UPI001F221301|nr:ATP-binding protein [Pseudomonas sp. KNUC1026]UFH51040.1 ATP-binding protein [Pseudomonas sp. KNUC1026]
MNVRVQVDTPGSLPAVALEPKLTARALQNILSNALRYAHSQVSVEARANGEDLIVVIEDDGEGIPEADYHQVFQPFFRLDRSRDRATGGVGLGLAISRSCMERQGGTLGVGKAALGGARFTLSLPLQYFQVSEAVTLRGAP